MAKNNNLGDFLTDIANAIRAKKGISGSINAQDFASEIGSISGGGSGDSGENSNPRGSVNDVTFYDYDGTVLYGFTKEEFLAMSEMPALPTQEGLICQGWNQTFEFAQEFVAKYGLMDLGALYITDDGATRIHIEIAANNTTIPLIFYQSQNNGITINWGDGNSQTTSGMYPSLNHTYTNAGEYVISLMPDDGVYLEFSGSIFGLSSKGINSDVARKLHIGKNFRRFESKVFQYCSLLSAVTLSNTLYSIGTDVFSYCYHLKCLIIPNSVTAINGNFVNSCYSLKTLITSSEYALPYVSYLYNLKRFIPVSSKGTNISFANLYSLRTIIIPEGVKTLTSAFMSNTLIPGLKIPSSVTSMASAACSYCYMLRFLDMSSHTSIPSCSSDSFKSSTKCKIIVPDNLYDQWITATNWSSIASQIIKKSDWDALNA